VTSGRSDGADLRLRLQTLGGPLQVLSLCGIAATRSEYGLFATRQVAELLVQLRLPAVANLSSSLGRLRAQDLLMRPSKETWALTPAGEAKLSVDGLRISPHSVEVSLGRYAVSELAERRHTVIPPFLGPMGAAGGLLDILEESPFEQNVMLITRFPRVPDDPIAALIPVLQKVAAEHGLRLLVSSDAMKDDTLWANVVTYMWASKYAIVLFDKPDDSLNSNVLVEIGGMLMSGRRCAILRDPSVPAMPTDLVGHIYKAVELADHEACAEAIHRWVRDDLGLGTCPTCPA
jgi:hypothetical protein